MLSHYRRDAPNATPGIRWTCRGPPGVALTEAEGGSRAQVHLQHERSQLSLRSRGRDPGESEGPARLAPHPHVGGLGVLGRDRRGHRRGRVEEEGTGVVMFGFGPGFGGSFGVLGRLAEVLGTVVIAAVVVGVTVLLVRFPLVATRAAQLYVARHELPKPATERRSYAPEPPAPAASVPGPAPAATAATPAASPATAASTPEPANPEAASVKSAAATVDETPAPKPASSHASTSATTVVPEVKPAGRAAAKTAAPKAAAPKAAAPKAAAPKAAAPGATAPKPAAKPASKPRTPKTPPAS